MLKQITIHPGKIYKIIAEWSEQHPYTFSMLLSVFITSYVLFYTPSLEVSDEDYSPTEQLQFLDIEEIQSAPRRTKKDITTNEADSSENNIERAVGTSDTENAVDISFYPNIAAPKPVRRLKKIYPAEAKERNIEATVFVELIIAANGIVKDVHIIGVRVSKEVPGDVRDRISKAFAHDAIKILLGEQFTPPIINGKKIPIKMEMPLKFRLE